MKWEYKEIALRNPSKCVIPIPNLEEATDILNSVGQEGWELVSVEGTRLEGIVIFWFKRGIDTK